MTALIVFLVILLVVGIAGYLIITRFQLGQTALVIFGIFLLVALLLFLFGVIPPVQWR